MGEGLRRDGAGLLGGGRPDCGRVPVRGRAPNGFLRLESKGPFCACAAHFKLRSWMRASGRAPGRARWIAAP